MRGAFGVVVLTALGSLVGCGGGGGDSLLPSGQAVTLPGRSTSDPAAATAPPTAAQTACAGVAAPTTLTTAQDIHDVRIVGSAVFFQAGTKVMRVGKDGKGATEVFSSPNLVRAYVDKNALITLESTDAAPDATLRVIQATNADVANAPYPEFPPAVDAAPADPNPAPDPNGGAAPTDPAAVDAALPGTTAATNFNAAGTQIFASDDGSFYVLADTDAGDTFAMVNKAAPGTQTVILAATNVLSHPQLVGTDIWYVKDQTSVVKIGVPADGAAPGDPTDMFALDPTDSCSLAVSDAGAYCSLGTTVQRRDLDGKNPSTILDSATAKTSARLGALFPHDTTVYVPSDAPDPVVKNVIFAVQSTGTPAAQKFVACGRGLVTNVAVDATSIAWAEADGGVYVAPR